MALALPEKLPPLVRACATTIFFPSQASQGAKSSRFDSKRSFTTFHPLFTGSAMQDVEFFFSSGTFVSTITVAVMVKVVGRVASRDGPDSG